MVSHMQSSPRNKTLLCLLLLVGGAGCQSKYRTVLLNPFELFEQRDRNALNSRKMSWESQQTLRQLFLDKRFHSDPDQVIGQLVNHPLRTAHSDIQIVLTEALLLRARRHLGRDPKQEMAYYIYAAMYAYDYLFAEDQALQTSTLTPSYRLMADIYNLAVSRVITLRSKRPDPWAPLAFEDRGVQYSFEVLKSQEHLIDPEHFKSLYPVHEINISGVDNRYVTRGLGAPFAAIVEEPSAKPPFGPFHAAKKTAYPVTAVLSFAPLKNQGLIQSRQISLAFYDPLEDDSIQIKGKTIPLEADFTTPLVLLFQDFRPIKFALTHLFNSEKLLDRAGLYMYEPYRPDKIPVVLVHGLMSSSETWIPMFNDLQGDPELRNRYQFWFFSYPTGLPILYSSSILREELERVRALYDPDGTSATFNQTVIVGHSMGGLLTRLMVQESGTSYWDAIFTQPLSSMTLDSETRESLQSGLFFEPLPFVRRAIFVATPHRGSKMADTWFSRIASTFVKLPAVFAEGAETFLSNDANRSSLHEQFTKKSPNSLDLLSPTSHFMKATQSVPLHPEIPYHSIIGIRKAKSGPGSSDGVVRYDSSHLDNVISEKLVPTHHETHRHPLAIAEIKRILKLHLKSIEDLEPLTK